MAEGTGSRERLIDAALEQVELRGYRAATTKRIAAAAGLNEASVFRLFGSKDALLRIAIYERTISTRSLPAADQMWARDLERDLVHVLDLYLRRYVVQMAVYRVFMMRTDYDVEMNAEIFAKVQGIIRHFADHLAYLHREGLAGFADFDALAELVFSRILIVALDITVDGPDEATVTDRVEEFSRSYAAFLGSILPPPD